MRAVSSTEFDTFQQLTSGQVENLAIASTELNGVETAAIVAVGMDGDEYVLTPIAVLVNDDIMAMLSRPDTDLEDKPYACPFECEFEADSEMEMNEHLDVHHNNDA